MAPGPGGELGNKIRRRSGADRPKRWNDLSSRQRGSIVAGGVIQVLLAVAALADLRRRPSDQTVPNAAEVWVIGTVWVTHPVSARRWSRKPGGSWT